MLSNTVPYGSHSGQQGSPPQDSAQPGHVYPPDQYGQGQPQGTYPPREGYPPPGYPPPRQGYAATPERLHTPYQASYAGPPYQGQWEQPPPHQHGYGEPPPGQYGQAAPPPTSLHYSNYHPQGYPQGGQLPGSNDAPSPGQYHQQPQMSGPPNPASPGYDPLVATPMDMTFVAKTVREAIEGFGTNDKSLINAVANLDPLQVVGLRQAYASSLKRDIEKDIEGDTSGDYRDALLAIVRGPLLHDVYCVQRAIKGLGTKETMLNDVLIGRSNADMRAIKTAYQQLFGEDMAVKVRGDLSGKTETLFTMIMAATRNEDSSPVHPQQIDKDVERLHDATEAQIGTAEVKFCELLTGQSDGQVRAIAQRYQQRFKKSLDAVVSKEFGGHMKEALLLLIARANDRTMTDAIQLEDTMKGVGTKNELLVQRVVRLHWDRQHLEQVKRAYQYKYNRDLVDRVKRETSGKYGKVMVRCLA